MTTVSKASDTTAGGKTGKGKGGRKLPEELVRRREVEVARLVYRRIPMDLIADIVGVGRSQAYADFVSFRKRSAAEAGPTIRDMLEEMLRAAWQAHDAAPANLKHQHMKNIIAIVDRLAKTVGLELRATAQVDARTQILAANADITMNEQNNLLQFPVERAAARSGFGIVDAYTFATHEDYCGLDLSDKPMERLILEQFMRAGSGYNELVAVVGMRSGKGTIGSVAVWYKIYKLLELGNPQRYYGLAQGQTISTINMALSETQALQNVFKHLKDRLEHGGRWFQDLRKYCDEHLGNHWLGNLEIRLPKDLAMRCGHSRASTKVGGSNIALVLDEICKYKNTDGTDNAEQVYTEMKATTATFGEDSLVVSIASPEWTGDYGMQLLQMAVETEDMPLADRCPACRARAEQPSYQPSPSKSHPRMYGLTMPTWEANTALTFERLWDTQNGAANPRAFWRDFGAKPAEVEEGYYPDPERWERQADKTMRYPYDAAGRLAEWWKPCCDSRRFVHIDLGLTRDAAGVAMAHKPVPGCPYYQTVHGQPNPKAKEVAVDICVQIKPPGKKDSTTKPEISFEAIRQLVRDWDARGFQIKSGRVTYDGFQSVDSRQILRREGFRASEFSVDKDLKAHDTLQELINRDALAYIGHPVLIREGKQLQLKSGRKVDHPPRGSKDVVDAVAASVYHAKRYGGRRKFIGGSQTEKEE